MQQLKFIILPGSFSLCRLDASSIIPGWVSASPFYTISKTAKELSVVCESRCVPINIQRSDNWKLLMIDDVLDLSLTGITAKFSTALADVNVNLCVIATYDTDYIMVKKEKLSIAKDALIKSGFRVE